MTKRGALKAGLWITGLALGALIVEDMSAYERDIFLELLKLIVPLALIGVTLMVVGLFLAVGVLAGVLYVAEYAMANRPRRKHGPSRAYVRPMGSAREREVAQRPSEP